MAEVAGKPGLERSSIGCWVLDVFPNLYLSSVRPHQAVRTNLPMSTIFKTLWKLSGGEFGRMRMNLRNQERIGSILAGGTLMAVALGRSRSSRWVLFGIGAGLVLRGATGHCALYEQLGIDRRDRRERDGVPGNQGLRIEHAVEVACPAPELYQFWRNVGQLPRILRHVESVQPIDEWHSHWVARGPLGPPLEWDAEIINERENELIAWQSVHGASLKNAGTVRFEALAPNLTRVRVCLELQPVGGTALLTLARLFGTDPQRELEDDLARFKDFAERELTPASHSLN
jgi:uncharacterized membrane protein